MSEEAKAVALNIFSNALWALLIAVPPLLIWIVSMFSRYLVGGKFRRAGVIAFFPDRDSYASDRKLNLEDYLKTAAHSLTYAGHWLAISTDHRNTLTALSEMVAAGRKIDIVMLDQNLSNEMVAVYARFFSRSDADLRERISSAWTKVIAWRDGLSSDGRRLVTLRSHTEFVSNSAFMFDEDQRSQKILIDQKIWGLDRADSFGIELSFDRGRSSNKSMPSLYRRYSQSIRKLRHSARLVP